MKNLVLHRPDEDSWITFIKKRINNNLNFLAIAEGETGIGKSWSMMSIAHSIDPTFEASQVVFSFKGVMELLNSEDFMKKKWKIIVFDESQTDISNRAWQSLTNKLMNFLLSTFRHRNVILLFTSPYSDFLDSQTMKLMHCKFEVRGHSRKTQLTQIRPKILQYNSTLKKFYYHSLHVIKDKKVHKLVFWNVRKPPEHLIEPYEKAKLEFTTKLNKEILADLQNVSQKKNKKEIVNDESIGKTDYQKAILRYQELGVKDRKELNEKLKQEGFCSALPKICRAIKQLRKYGGRISL